MQKTRCPSHYILANLIAVSIYCTTAVEASEIEAIQTAQNSTLDIKTQGYNVDFDIFVDQSGTENTGKIRIDSALQMLAIQAGQNNYFAVSAMSGSSDISLYQNGNNNTLDIYLDGLSNISSVEQSGTSNYLDLDISGSNNLSDIEQQGSNSSVTLNQSGSDNALYLFQSCGNCSLVANQSSNSLIFNITQYGDNSQITID